MRRLAVFVNNQFAGILTEKELGRGYQFKYDDSYLNLDYNPISLTLPKRAEPFERLGTLIGLTDKRIQRVLDKYMQLPLLTSQLVSNSFLDNKLKRSYLRIVEERTKRFIRQSE